MDDGRWNPQNHRSSPGMAEFTMSFKFENLEVWHLSLGYIDLVYAISDLLPRHEEFNLKSQIRRAATSIALNIAEGSMGQTSVEQARFLGFALRSLVETVACQHLIRRRQYLNDVSSLDVAYHQSEILSKKLYTFRKSISPDQSWVREGDLPYISE